MNDRRRTDAMSSALTLEPSTTAPFRQPRTPCRTPLLLLFATSLVASSCVPPTCLSSNLGASPKRGYWGQVIVYSAPVEGPLESWRRWPPRLSGRFDVNDEFTLDVQGGMTVARGAQPSSCTRVSQERLAKVERLWLSYLDRSQPGPVLYVLTNPFTGPDWYDEGPIVHLQFLASGADFQLFWDGRLDLPEQLDAAVIGTLEMVCSKRRSAKKLLRALPPQVGARLGCAPTTRRAQLSSTTTLPPSLPPS